MRNMNLQPNDYDIDIPFNISQETNNWYVGIDIGGLAKQVFSIFDEFNLRGEYIDIACGTGYLLLKLCKYFDITGLGVDLHPPFIKNAILLTEKNRLKCSFQIQDANEFINQSHFDWDIASAIATGEILGNLTETFDKIRSLVKSEGFLIIGWIEEKPNALLELSKLKNHIQEKIGDEVISVSCLEVSGNLDKEIERLKNLVEQVNSPLEKKRLIVWYEERKKLIEKIRGVSFLKIVLLIRKK